MVRARVRLMIEITARAGAYRKGLLAAAKHLSPEEAAIISDLERHGLQVSQLHDVLCGGHVLVDDPQLYEDWRFTAVSHPRISSHHRDIDKARYPDMGMRGQADPANQLGQALTGRAGRGLFGSSEVWVIETPPRSFAAILGQLREQPPPAVWVEGAPS